MLIKDHDAIISALNKKVGKKLCPMCSSASGFTVDIHEMQETSFNRNEEGLKITGEHRYVPCAMMACNNCGYAVKFVLEKLLDNPEYISTSIAK